MMLSKYKNTVIISVITLVVLVISVIVIVSINTERSAQREIQTAEEALQEKADPVEREESEHKDQPLEEDEADHSAHDHEGSTAVMVGDIEITSDQEVDTYSNQATSAALAYISQRTNEPNEERQAKLRSVFSSNSPVINRLAPSVDPTYTRPATSSATVLYYDWNTTTQEFVVFVALSISTTNSSGQTVSEINQGYDVSLRYIDGKFQPYNIEFSRRPVVVR